jgi:hypothetical protein
MAKATLMALLAGAVLTVPSPLTAQEWGRGPTPRSGVCFYKDPDFSGEYLRATACARCRMA